MNEDIKQRPNRCPHMNCAVVHTGQCNCDMTEYCFQCRQGVLNQNKYLILTGFLDKALPKNPKEPMIAIPLSNCNESIEVVMGIIAKELTKLSNNE